MKQFLTAERQNPLEKLSVFQGGFVAVANRKIRLNHIALSSTMRNFVVYIFRSPNLADALLPDAVFPIKFIVPERIFFAEPHYAPHFPLDIFLRSRKKHARIDIPDEPMPLAVPFRKPLHIGTRFEKQHVRPAVHDCVGKFSVIAVGCKQYLFPRPLARFQKLFQIRKNIAVIPLPRSKFAACPRYVVVHHQHGHAAFGKRIVKLLYPFVVTLHDFVEFLIRNEPNYERSISRHARGI